MVEEWRDRETEDKEQNSNAVSNESKILLYVVVNSLIIMMKNQSSERMDENG